MVLSFSAGGLSTSVTISSADTARIVTAYTGLLGLSNPTNQQIVNAIGSGIFDLIKTNVLAYETSVAQRAQIASIQPITLT